MSEIWGARPGYLDGVQESAWRDLWVRRAQGIWFSGGGAFSGTGYPVVYIRRSW